MSHESYPERPIPVPYSPERSYRHASVPASGRQMSTTPRAQRLPELGHEPSSQSSDENSQPVAGEGDITPSPSRSEDAFGPFSDVPRETAYGSDSPSGSDRQQDDAQSDPRLEDSYTELQRDRPANTVQEQDPRLGDSYAELQRDHPEHIVQQEALEHHPELRMRSPRDPSSESEEELALMNIPIGKILPTFLTVAAEETEPFEPKTLRQAMSDTGWPEWEKAMTDEVNSLKQNKTWELVDPPKDRRVLSGKWVFKLKRGSHGEVVRHKCRWVVRGFTQEEGIDYDETFASVVKPMSYKALLAIAAALDLEIEQMDVKTAFLYGYIDHEIYVEQPHHMIDGTTKVCKLRKALYGLKQAPRIWYQTLTNFLRNLGFEPINADFGIFVRSGVYIAVYVDDLLIIGPSIAEIKKIKRSLRNRFQMTDLGPCSYYLGMSIQRDRQNRILYLSQEAYIHKLLHQFQMNDCTTVTTPIDTSPMPENEPDYVCPANQRIEYQRIVGSLCISCWGPEAILHTPSRWRVGTCPIRDRNM
jgi:hypothetical protein